jgi:hypothetical protein
VTPKGKSREIRKETVDKPHPGLIGFMANGGTRQDQEGSMRKSGLLLGALVLAGCATTKPPEVPQYQTGFGWACARVCQREYNLCTADCTHMVKSGCLSECSRSLQTCYDFCLEEESKPSP